VVIPAEWPAIKQQTLHALRNGLMQYEDTFPFLFLQGMLTGFAVKREIKHLVIDEAQDYTTIQYAILAQLFPNCSWTILGDPAQVVHPFLQTADFETVATIIVKGAPALFQLQRSYRSTRQIQAFCQALLPPAAKTESIQRDGPLPRVIRIHSAGLMSGMVVQEIRALQNEGQQFIAIIGKTVHDCRNIYKALSDQIKLSLITDEEDEFRRGVIIAPAYLAKGLEFDSVLIPNADSSNYGSETDRHLLYTICTRALHRLILFHYGELSPLISAFDPQLYLSK
jgi:DNA helicase-2/ATP-dependent DNA helicase PcrA